MAHLKIIRTALFASVVTLAIPALAQAFGESVVTGIVAAKGVEAATTAADGDDD